LYFSVIIAVLGVALLHANGRQRAVLVVVALMTLILPVCLTIATVDANGAIWQGRYFLPFVGGILVLSGTVIDEAEGSLSVGLEVAGAAMLALAQGWSVWNVATSESRRPASQLGPDWVTLPPLLLGLVVVLAWAVLALSTFRADQVTDRAA
jgi:hypothetical protein